VLWDVDGVIIRHERKFRDTLSSEKYRKPAKVLEEFYATGVNEDCDKGSKDPVDAFKPFLDRIGWESSVERYLESQYAFERQYIDFSLLDRIQALRKRGFPCYLTTNQNRHRKEFIVDALGAEANFDGSFFSCDMGAVKQEKKYWDIVKSRLGEAHPGMLLKDLLLLDDLEDNILSAETNGIRGEIIGQASDIDSALAGL
jgi:putative hydrolase of the HAD superfamily